MTVRIGKEVKLPFASVPVSALLYTRDLCRESRMFSLTGMVPALRQSEHRRRLVRERARESKQVGHLAYPHSKVRRL